MKKITYHFSFEQSEPVVVEFEIDKSTENMAEPAMSEVPRWVDLDYNQCSNCSLDPETTTYCPVALNILDIVKKFESKMSYTETFVQVFTEERSYCKQLPLQKALSSLIGVIMVYSGCPVMEKLRPMGYFHLPFSSIDETVYRVLSMYLLGQFARMKHGKEPDWELNQLKEIYDGINIVNNTFPHRLSLVTQGDSSMNGLVILGNFGQFVSFSIDEGMFDTIESLFESYYSEE